MQSSRPLLDFTQAASPAPTAVPVHRQLAAMALMLVCLLALLALWETVAWMTGARAGWMVLTMAAGVALALRIGGYPREPSRVALALVGSTLGIVAGLWLVAVLPIAAMMGQLPWTAASRMGPDLAWILTRLGSTPLDWSLMALAFPLAAWLAR